VVTLLSRIFFAHPEPSLEIAMTLPFDFSTSLWLRSIPVWEWEALPEPRADGPPADGGGESAGSPTEGMAAVPGAAAADPSSPERPGFRLVCTRFEIAASVFWYPADSPLSRPWLVREHDDRKSNRAEVPPLLPNPADLAARDATLRASEDDAAG
jgi:hypothetical protein